MVRTERSVSSHLSHRELIMLREHILLLFWLFCCTSALIKKKSADEQGKPQSSVISEVVDKSTEKTPQISTSSLPSKSADSVGWGSAAKVTQRSEDASRMISLQPGTRDLQLGLQFTVPFLNIPLRSLFGVNNADSVNTLGGGTGAGIGGFDTLLTAVQRGLPVILLVGLLAASVVIMVPFLATATGGRGISETLNQFGFSRRHEEGSRLLDMLSRFDDVLASRDIRPIACVQQTLCRYSQTAASAVQTGSASSTQLIVEGLAKSMYVSHFLEGTSVGEAVTAGRAGDHCATVFPHCALTTDRLASALTRYITAVV